MPARRVPTRSGHTQNVPIGPDWAGSKVPAPIAAAAVPVGTDLAKKATLAAGYAEDQPVGTTREVEQGATIARGSGGALSR
jgi:hypothetical protein